MANSKHVKRVRELEGLIESKKDQLNSLSEDKIDLQKQLIQAESICKQ